jgi:hypothetical protein
MTTTNENFVPYHIGVRDTRPTRPKARVKNGTRGTGFAHSYTIRDGNHVSFVEGGFLSALCRNNPSFTSQTQALNTTP